MKRKVKVKVVKNTNQCSILKGRLGYIDGYMRGRDGAPCAVVVSRDEIDLISLLNLKGISDQEYKNRDYQ